MIFEPTLICRGSQLWSWSLLLFGSVLSYNTHCCGPQPQPLRPLEHLGSLPTAHMWIHRFEPNLPTFLMALDSGVTRTPQCGHHVVCHSPSCPPTYLLRSPLQWPEGLEEKLVLAVLCPSLCPAWCQPQAWVQWGTHGGHLVFEVSGPHN